MKFIQRMWNKITKKIKKLCFRKHANADFEKMFSEKFWFILSNEKLRLLSAAENVITLPDSSVSWTRLRDIRSHLNIQNEKCFELLSMKFAFMKP